MNRRPAACVVGLAALLSLWPPAPLPRARALAGDGAMLYVFNAPESAGDVRYDYHWEILRTALDKTAPAWGPYRMQKSAPMNEKRQAHELLHASGKLTVMYLDTTPVFERSLHGVHIPVDRGLGGYRVFLIRKERKDDFRELRTLAQLKRLKFGLGLGWVDVEVMRRNGLHVVTGSSYEGLFEMLVHRRFDVFLRGATEVLDEHARRARDLPDLWIESSLLLYYPLPMYFWFPRTPEGKRLAERAEAGMRAMIDDGTYDRIFDQHQRSKIERLQLSRRHILHLGNPLLGPETPFADERLWFDPTSYR